MSERATANVVCPCVRPFFPAAGPNTRMHSARPALRAERGWRTRPPPGPPRREPNRAAALRAGLGSNPAPVEAVGVVGLLACAVRQSQRLLIIPPPAARPPPAADNAVRTTAHALVPRCERARVRVLVTGVVVMDARNCNESA